MQRGFYYSAVIGFLNFFFMEAIAAFVAYIYSMVFDTPKVTLGQERMGSDPVCFNLLQ